jgi:hypothetical protein
LGISVDDNTILIKLSNKLVWEMAMYENGLDKFVNKGRDPKRLIKLSMKRDLVFFLIL